MVDKIVHKGDAVKAINEDRIEGYLVRFTAPDDPDLHGEYFNQDTDFWIEKGYPIKGQPVLLEHGLDDAFKWIPVGVIEDVSEDDIGLWIQARLHDRAYYEDMLEKMSQRGAVSADKSTLSRKAEIMARAVRAYVGTGKVGWSSGALPQSVIKGEDGRHIKSWAIIEGSITMTPAEPDGTEIAIRKSFDELATLISWELTHEPEAGHDPEAETATTSPIVHDQKTGATKMSPEQVLELVRQYIGAALEQIASAMSGEPMESISKAEEEEVVAEISDAVSEMTDDELKAMDEEEVGKMIADAALRLIEKKQRKAAKVRNSVAKAASERAALNRATPAPSQAGGGFSGSAPRIQVKSRFDHWTAEDFSFAYQIAEAGGNQFRGLKRVMADQGALLEFADKATKAYQSGAIKLDPQAVKTLNAIKANEVMQSTLASYGDDWVPTLWNDAVWDKPRTDLVAPNAFDMIDMPSNPYEYPVVGTDPTIYYISETTGTAQLSLDSTTAPITSSRVNTSKTTFTAKKFGTNVLVSSELEEDALAFTIPQLRQQAQDALLHAVDYVILNGDTATTGNINSDGETISATDRSYLGMNGLIKQALVTASSNALNAGASAPTLSHIRALRGLLASPVGANPRNLALIMDVQSYLKLLNDGAVLTEDKYGRDATVLTGQLGSIDGIPVFASEDMYLADSDGKITQTDNVVDRGRILLVHRPSWKVGYRRRPTQSMTFIPYFDVWSMVVSVRFDLAGRTEGASDDTVAILYNIGI